MLLTILIAILFSEIVFKFNSKATINNRKFDKFYSIENGVNLPSNFAF